MIWSENVLHSQTSATAATLVCVDTIRVRVAAGERGSRHAQVKVSGVSYM